MIVLVTLIVLIVLLIFANVKYNEYYWKRRGVVIWKKSQTMGVFWLYLRGDKAMFQIFDEMVKDCSSATVIAFNSLFTPSIFLNNQNNINHVTISDFHSFSHRGLEYREDDKLANNIAFLHGRKWKILRQALSPLFTSTKLKKMHYIVDKCARDFVYLLKNDSDKLKGDTYMIMKTYCCAALTAAIFGIGTDSPFESPFLKITSQALAPTFWKNFKYALSAVSPKLFHFLGISLFSVQEEVFIETMKEVIKQRKESADTKHDFIDLCVNLQNKGLLVDPETGYSLEASDEIMAAQAYIFFLAGLEPCATGLFVTLFELGRNPEIQKRLQRDIDAGFEKYSGDLPYDAIVEMKYLDMVLKEALRMHPPISYNIRECVTDAILPVGNIKIDKGTKVYIPIYSQHHNPSYFSDPMVFNPERFSYEKESSDYYVPFGQGSRTCFGMRYAQIKIKTGIVHLLRNFEVKSHLKYGDVKYEKDYLFLMLKDVDFVMIPRKNTH